MFDLSNKFYNRMYKKDLYFGDNKEKVPLFDFYAKCMLLVAVLSRVLFAALAIMISLKTENGLIVSPFVEVQAGDYPFYWQNSVDSFATLKEPFLFFFQGGSFEDWFQTKLHPGPIFPWLLNVLNYPKQPIYLASIYLMASSLLVFGWVLYYRAREVSLWGQLALIAYPLALWYSLALSTELPMSVALFIFFCGALATRQFPFWGISSVLTGFILMLMIRPNSLCLFPAVLFVIFLNRDDMSRWLAVVIFVLITIIFVYFVAYYAPYFHMMQEASRASINVTYWGLHTQQYSEGLFPNLPLLLDKVISNVALIASKVIYASGLRPSYSGTSTLLISFRLMAGVLVLPGIFYCIYRGSWLESILLFGFLFPLLITVGQERYLLPIAPLLLLYGGIFWKDLFLYIRNRFIL